MNRIVFILCCLILFSSCGSEIQYSGKYIGQSPAGDTPEIFALGFISTGLNEGSCAFTPDGRELFFHVVYYKDHQFRVSLAATREINSAWMPPEFLPFSGSKYKDMYPFVTYDGKKMFFLSDRPAAGANKLNYWVVNRTLDGWSEPELYSGLAQVKGEVSGLSISDSGNIYFTVNDETGQFIYRSELINGEYSKPARLPENVNRAKYQFDGVISPDETYMIFCVYEGENSFGSTDLYISFRDSKDNWSRAVNMGKLFNTAGVDGPANISADGKYIFYSGRSENNNWLSDTLKYSDVKDFFQNYGSGNSDVYWVKSGIIEKFRNKIME